MCVCVCVCVCVCGGDGGGGLGVEGIFKDLSWKNFWLIWKVGILFRCGLANDNLKACAQCFRENDQKKKKSYKS